MSKFKLQNKKDFVEIDSSQKFLTGFIICHYDEIGLKGNNRKFFEEKLIENIKKSMKKNIPEISPDVRRISGRLIARFSNGEQKGKISEIMKNIFGIAHFSFAVACEQNMDAIKKTALEILSERKFKTFRISTQRSKKEFPLTSQEINAKVGEYVLDSFAEKEKGESSIRVDLKNPEATLFIEIVEKYAFVYSRKEKGQGGLPLGSSGKVVSLLSGGIDSPVASFYAMRRGARAIFVHFHSLPYTSPASVDKIRELVKFLNKFQIQSKLHLVPLATIQKQIMMKAPQKLRIILYRRFMMKIAERIAGAERAPALVTGDSLGQVASQTLENMAAIEEKIKIPVLRPLIGFDKKEIISKAEEIGSYDISILPHEDCCSLFMPKHPETKAKLGEVEAAERGLEVEKLIAEAIEETEVENIN